ncbi:GNAT family N-acetyltransferase [Frigidibacter sp. RF13]|uniref:GNAT family N-acetyltransferase n=1 Tax=Frigidibacter sp. RF13 TaxID=2997340 RepID=UPI00226F377C|nr:GNAT family N-acetyltransferase [Frigidibacter sp. RF13]MCY1127638.1 GNAT family N-acetyltransferase [Frigidibacter sp. RF13]
MAEIVVRPIRVTDIVTVVAMIRALAAHHGDTAAVTAETLIRDSLDDPPWCRILVAGAPDGPVGYAAFLPLHLLQYSRRGLDMHHLYVEPDWRGRGVGARLVDAGIGLARLVGCSYLSVGTAPGNDPAEAFYLKRGFEARPVTGGRFRLSLEAPDG